MLLLRSNEKMSYAKAAGLVLVTGASTGIGRAVAMHLGELGFHVLAGVRKAFDAESVEEEGRVRKIDLRAVTLDITSPAEVATSVERVKHIVGETGLRALVNNAGTCVIGPTEFVSLDDWRKQFEVNLFGQIAMTQAMLPLLRQHAQWHGTGTARIVLMSSVSGRISQPMLAPYTASKHALEAVGDSLRLELRRTGIGVSLIEPGAIQSEIWTKGQSQVSQFAQGTPAFSMYAPELQGVEHAAKTSMINAIDAQHVARAVGKAITKKSAPPRIVVGSDAKFGTLLKRVLPTSVMDRLIARVFSGK
jgi:NAD(P)-dependent dehydrogenase (short-subunit alcohol dehydrogenase family)